MRNTLIILTGFVLLAGLVIGCGESQVVTTTTTTTTTASTTTTTISGDLIYPSNLEYLGAFRMPEGVSDTIGWEYGGSGLAYYSSGDSTGPDDGYPGSLYGIGHDQTMYVSEINIPIPIISASKNLGALNTASTLRTFTNIRTGVGDLEGMFNRADIRRAGLAHLPAQGAQTTGKLYACFGAHFQEDDQNVASHMWANMDLSGHQGAWYVLDNRSVTLYSTNDYMFEIPEDFANTYLGGGRLATGRYRDGGWSGMGPSLFAIAPWEEGNPPANNTILPATALIRYASTNDAGYLFGEDYSLNNYLHSDEWSGAAWLTAGSRSAVIFVGTKGTGTDEAWYGTYLEPCTACPEREAPTRGWWSPSFEAQIIFYDPSDLAAVASGSMQPYEPQPYATMNIDSILYRIDKMSTEYPDFPVNQNKYRLGACAYDNARRLLYIVEYRGDAENERALMHVFRVN
jgi:hypothetical protein